MGFQPILLLLVLYLAQFSDAKELNLRSIIKPNDNGITWAVLVAGSNGYYNYRHQVIRNLTKVYLKFLFTIISHMNKT